MFSFFRIFEETIKTMGTKRDDEKEKGNKKKCKDEERQKICEILNKAAEKGEWVSLEDLLEDVNKIRSKYDEGAFIESDVLDNCIRPLIKAIENLRNDKVIGEECTIERKNNKFRAFEGINEVNEKYLSRQNQIPGKVIEMVRGNLNYSLLNQIQNWLIEKKEQLKEEKKEPLLKDIIFISIEDSLYLDENNKEELIKEQKHLYFLTRWILNKTPIKITYEPLSCKEKEKKEEDTLTFSPEYLRRVGRKWMVYGMSKSELFRESKFVNLVLNRIVKMEPAGEEFEASGIDYTIDPFKNQMTYHALNTELYKKTESNDIDEDKITTEVVLKIRKWKQRDGGGMWISPFDRIKQEKLHYSQRDLTEAELELKGLPQDDDYGYQLLKVTDADYIWPILLGWGADIEVVEPDSLREKMKKEVEELQKKYASPLAASSN